MAKRQSKSAPGTRNGERRNGKAFKSGKTPAVREAERIEKAAAKKARKESAE